MQPLSGLCSSSGVSCSNWPQSPGETAFGRSIRSFTKEAFSKTGFCGPLFQRISWHVLPFQRRLDMVCCVPLKSTKCESCSFSASSVPELYSEFRHNKPRPRLSSSFPSNFFARVFVRRQTTHVTDMTINSVCSGNAANVSVLSPIVKLVIFDVPWNSTAIYGYVWPTSLPLSIIVQQPVTAIPLVSALTIVRPVVTRPFERDRRSETQHCGNVNVCKQTSPTTPDAITSTLRARPR